MAHIQLTGTLYDPTNQLSTKTKLRFTCTSGFGDTLKTSVVTIQTSATGTYDFNLVYGMHMIEANYGGHWNFLGNVNVTDATPAIQTVNQLLEDFSVPLPDETTDIPSYRAMNLMGDWAAAAGNFPPDPTYPTRLSDVWTVTTSGTMDTGQGYTMEVNAGELIYWSITNQRWQRQGKFLGEGELAVGGSDGQIEAQTMANLFSGLVRVYTLTGAQTSTTITHGKGRRVVPMYFNSSNVLEYPIYTQNDSEHNTITITAAEALNGILILI